MELADDIYEKILALSDEGDQLIAEQLFTRAEAKWIAALRLLPEPKSDWEASTWLLASVGDARYQQGNYASAREAFFDALNCPDGQSNPFIHYRLGQCEIKLGRDKSGVDHLLRAYMLDGETIFNSEPDGSEFLKILKTNDLM
jgi:tetratricopeptide (TPR) repeat protein